MIRRPPRSPLFPSTPPSRPPQPHRPPARETLPYGPHRDLRRRLDRVTVGARADRVPVDQHGRLLLPGRAGGEDRGAGRTGVSRARGVGGAGEVGRAAWRGRGEISGGGGSFKKRKRKNVEGSVVKKKKQTPDGKQKRDGLDIQGRTKLALLRVNSEETETDAQRGSRQR